MKHFVIISGGTIDDSFADRWFEEEKPDAVIAADAGMEYLYRSHRVPDVIVGDFDYFKTLPGVAIQKLIPEKDDTDTESAIRLAIRRGAECITLLGATGTRLDHVLGNIELLGIGLKAGIPIQICDAHNRIRMIDRGMTLARKEQFGTYVSLIPYTECVEHLTLTGLKYPLTDACLRGFCSLGVSNEIVADTAEISFESGILLVVESKDR